MAEMHLIVGISANETPEACVWRFDGGVPTRSYAKTKLRAANPRESKSDWDRISFPEKITNELIQAVEKEGFKIRSESKGITVDAIGISIPGNINSEHHVVRNIGRFHYAPHHAFGVYKDSLAETNLKEQCHITLPLFMHNDVTCMARADSYLLFEDIYESLVYIYVDKGVNIGVQINGEPLRSAMHPELGHLRARLEGKPSKWTLKGKDNFCGFAHEGCFESILAKSALKQRFDLDRMLQGGEGFAAEREFIAGCISQLCEIVVLAFSPEKVVIGGYITDTLLKRVHSIFNSDLKGCPFYPERKKADFIERSPNSPDEIAALGAALLAHKGLMKQRK
jgi:predicted NBD/HSP70 family sugar kinase